MKVKSKHVITITYVLLTSVAVIGLILQGDQPPAQHHFRTPGNFAAAGGSSR